MKSDTNLHRLLSDRTTGASAPPVDGNRRRAMHRWLDDREGAAQNWASTSSEGLDRAKSQLGTRRDVFDGLLPEAGPARIEKRRLGSRPLSAVVSRFMWEATFIVMLGAWAALWLARHTFGEM